MRSSPASKREIARASAPAMPGAVLPRSPERGRAVGEHARQGRQVAQTLLGEAVAPSPGAAGAGRDPPPAIGAGPRPGIRPQSDAAGLKEAKRGDQLAKGLDGAGAGVRRRLSVFLAPLAGADPRRGEEGGLPACGAGPLRGPGLGGHLDGVGANDRRGRKLEPHQRHLQPAQRDDHLDLVFRRLAAGLELGDRLAQPLAVEREVGGVRPQTAQEDDPGKLGALAGIRRDVDPELLEVRARELGRFDRRAGRSERVELAAAPGHGRGRSARSAARTAAAASRCPAPRTS